MKIKSIMIDGILKQNPVLKLILGTCSVLALSANAINGLGMGAAVIFVLTLSNIIISLLRNIIPDKVRIPAYILVIATFVTIVQMLMNYLASISELANQIYEAMGVFLPLIVVNCMILARAESFASKNNVGLSALDGIFQGVGYMLALTSMGIFREILGNGSIFGVKLWNFKIAFFSAGAGAFLTYGIFIAIFMIIVKKYENYEKNKLIVKEAE